MTTIAYRDGVLAADTLTNGGGSVLAKGTIKIGGKNGLLWCSSGCAASGKRLRDWIVSGMRGDSPTLGEGAGGAIFLPSGDVLVMHTAGYELRRGLPFYAEGSGDEYAVGAMQVGATAEEAVRAAMAWDIYTGGDVMVLRR